MPRPSNWNSPTAAVRVPAHAVDAVIALARQLDKEPPQSFVQNPSGPYLVSDGEDRYLIPTPTAPPEMWEQADRLIDELFHEHDQDDLLLILAKLAKHWGKPINA